MTNETIGWLITIGILVLFVIFNSMKKINEISTRKIGSSFKRIRTNFMGITK